MQVRIIPELKYRVETIEGVHVGDFAKADEWHGLARLVCQRTGAIIDHQDTLIVESMDWTEELVTRIFGEQPKARTATVVKASPDLMAKIADTTQ